MKSGKGSIVLQLTISVHPCARTDAVVMRPLTEQETKVFFEKLSKYIGRNITYLIDRSDEKHCFMMQKDRVYYVSESVSKYATCFSREKLIALGVCFGKFTKSGKFKLHITSLDYLAQYCRYKVWIKDSAEQSYLYGNHILKAHVAKVSDDVPEHAGAVVFSTNETPLGFVTTGKGAAEIQRMDPTGIVAFHQADIGEYLRNEDTLL